MNFEHKKPTLTTSDVFADFTETRKKQFAFLESAHGLQLQESQQYGREFVVVFGNELYRVTINFEYPGPPWIAIEKKAGKRWKRKGLHQLYKRAFRKKMPGTAAEAKMLNGSYDLTNLPELSEILRNHWDELMAAF